MSPLLLQVLFGFLRHALGGAGVWLIDRGIVDSAQFNELLAGVVFVAVTLVWTAWNKWTTKREFFTAAGTVGKITLDEVRAAIKHGTSASPTTEASEVPSVRSTFK